MKKLVKLATAAACTLGVSFSAMAYIPAPGDCNGWLRLLNHCEARGTGTIYHFTCAEVYYTWQDCVAGNNFRSVELGRKEG